MRDYVNPLSVGVAFSVVILQLVTVAILGSIAASLAPIGRMASSVEQAGQVAAGIAARGLGGY